MPTDWFRRSGREVYALHPAPPGTALGRDEAMARSLAKLVRELARVSELDRNAAIDDAADGYLAAHYNAGGSFDHPLSYPARPDLGDAS